MIYVEKQCLAEVEMLAHTLPAGWTPGTQPLPKLQMLQQLGEYLNIT